MQDSWQPTHIHQYSDCHCRTFYMWKKGTEQQQKTWINQQTTCLQCWSINIISIKISIWKPNINLSPVKSYWFGQTHRGNSVTHIHTLCRTAQIVVQSSNTYYKSHSYANGKKFNLVLIVCVCLRVFACITIISSLNKKPIRHIQSIWLFEANKHQAPIYCIFAQCVWIIIIYIESIWSGWRHIKAAASQEM